MNTSGPRSRLVLYEQEGEKHLFCAIMEGDTPPGFVDAKHWRFARTLDGQEPRPAGFSIHEASDALSMMGFYLFCETDET
jgi:hypothetical protein